MSSQDPGTKVKPPPEPNETSPLLKHAQNGQTRAADAPAAAAPRDQHHQQQQPSTIDTAVNTGHDIDTVPFSARPPDTVRTDYSWTTPIGAPLRPADDESLLIFRRAVGINSDRAPTLTDSATLEKGRRRAVGIYRAVRENRARKRTAHHALGALLYASHFLQIVLAAVLTALGPNAKNFEVAITVLGAANTVTAGVLAVLKGSGMIERLAKDEVEFRKLQDWIEETESLLAVGVIGRNRRDVGVLVEVAFKKYNACFGQSYEVMSSSDINGAAAARGARNPSTTQE